MRVRRDLIIPVLTILLVLVVAVAVNLNALQEGLDEMYDWCIGSFGWLFLAVDLCCLVFSLWVMFGRYKDVVLGGSDCKPRFSTLAWAGMMFTTSCGAWLVVYGFLEPMYCVSQSAVPAGGSASSAYELGQMYAHFHWGPNAWCIYVPATVAIGYALYNRGGNGASVGEGLRAITNARWGRAVRAVANVIGVCGAVVAPVISIGTGMPLLVSLTQSLFGLSNEYRTAIQIAILFIWVLLFGASVYLGLQKGIKRLSSLNVKVALVLMLAFALLAGIVRVFSAEVNTIGLLFENFIRLSTYTDPYGEGSFVKGWTFGYWACYFVYMPLMGVFNAKISRGRRLKEIAFGQLVLCTLGCWLAMASFGNFTIGLDASGAVNVSALLVAGDEAGAIVTVVRHAPLPQVFMVALLLVMFVFLATTMDSSAFAAAEMTVVEREGEQESAAPRWLRVLWAVVAAIVAFAVLQVGGAKAVRSLCYMAGLPLAIVALLVIASAIKMLGKDHGAGNLELAEKGRGRYGEASDAGNGTC